MQYTLAEVATLYGVSRQRVHKWLTDHSLLSHCQKIGGGAERPGILLIDDALLVDAPFYSQAPQPADNAAVSEQGK